MNRNQLYNAPIPVRFFQRRARPGFNFSMESIFADVRERLASKESIV
jgi:hypothetical protein